jgi:hypothetical protein
LNTVSHCFLRAFVLYLGEGLFFLFSLDEVLGLCNALDSFKRDWNRMERLVRSAVANTRSNESKRVMEQLHHCQVQNELLNYENKGLKEALIAKKKHKKKHKKKGHVLDL